jgi:hypothetical protein
VECGAVDGEGGCPGFCKVGWRREVEEAVIYGEFDHDEVEPTMSR